MHVIQCPCKIDYFSFFLSGVEGQVVTATLGLWSGLPLESLWTLTPILVTFLMVLRAGTTAMDWVRHYN